MSSIEKWVDTFPTRRQEQGKNIFKKEKKKTEKKERKKHAGALSRKKIYNAPRTMSPSFRCVYRHKIYLFHGIAGW